MSASPSIRTRRWRPVLVVAAVSLLTVPAAAGVLSSITGAFPTMGFSVTGKNGPFITEAVGRKVDPASVKSGDSLGFGGGSLGDFQSAIIRMPATAKAIETLIAQTDAVWPGVHLAPIKVHILADGKYGPSALPDGSIVVPIGFLVRAESDDEIAFVLAHEYSHLALNHFSRSPQMADQRRMITTIAQVYAAAVAISEIRAQKTGQQVNFTLADRKRVADAQARAALAKGQLDWVLNNLIEPNWTRHQEDEADALGYDLASRQHYAAADGAGPAFGRLTADDVARAALVAQLQTQLHDSLNDAMAKDGQSAMQTGDPTALLNTFKKSLWEGVTDRVVRAADSWLQAQHRPPDARQKGLGDYIRTAYHADPPLAPLQTKWLDGVRATSEFRIAKTAVYALQSAQKSRSDGDYPEALKSIKIALATPYGPLPLFANEAGRIYRDAGDFKLADLAFTHADANLDQTLDGFRDHILMLVRQGDYKHALQVIDLYQSRSKTDKDFLPQLIRISFKLGQNEKALAYLDRCLALEDPPLRQSCSLSAYGPDDAEWDKLPQPTKDKLQRISDREATQTSVAGGLGSWLKGLQTPAPGSDQAKSQN